MVDAEIPERPSVFRALLADSLLLMIASQVGNVANLLFQVFMMRRLPDAEYGALASMLALVLALAVPLDAGRSWVAHAAVRLSRAGRIRGLRAWLRVSVLRLAAVGLAVILLSAGFRHDIADFLGIGRGLLVAWTGGIVALTLFQPVLIGALQGLELFRSFSLVSQAPGLLRLALGVLLVTQIRAAADLALAAQAVSVGCVLGLGLLWLRRLLRAWPERPAGNGDEAPTHWSYALRSLVVLTCAGILMNSDVVLAGKYFDPVLAGTFARSATLARAIVFLPGPIAFALFPKVVTVGPSRPGDKSLLAMATGMTALLIGLGAVAAAIAMPWIYPILTGAPADAAALSLTRGLLAAMAPLGLMMLLLNYSMAQGRFRSAYLLIPWAILYLGAVAIRHRSLADIVSALGLFSTLALVSLAIPLLRVRRCP